MKVRDQCGVCGGDGKSCLDCAADPCCASPRTSPQRCGAACAPLDASATHCKSSSTTRAAASWPPWPSQTSAATRISPPIEILSQRRPSSSLSETWCAPYAKCRAASPSRWPAAGLLGVDWPAAGLLGVDWPGGVAGGDIGHARSQLAPGIQRSG